jgi:uncharacterized membrane protein
MIRDSIEIDRTPEEVFAYLDDLSRHGEWQQQIIDVKLETEGPTRVGSRATETRRVPGGPRSFTYEITEHDPPRRASFRGLNGPLRPCGTVTLSPLDGGTRTRYTLEFFFETHGIGKLLVLLANRDAKKQIAKDMQLFKQKLEAGAASAPAPEPPRP